MGGGSGGSLSQREFDDLLNKVKKREESTKDVAFETNVNSFLSNLLVKANNRNTEAIQKHLDDIKSAFPDDVADTLKLLFGGSVAKSTYVEGLSDIDALVLLNGSDLQDMAPDQVKRYFFEKLKERFPKVPIKQGTLCVTIEFNDAEIQLLPAVKHGAGYRIADVSGKNWSHIHPRKFSAELTKVNMKQGNRVVPTIKLAKVINSLMSKDSQLTGYHIESLAVKVFKAYTGPNTTKPMLAYFFEQAAGLVKTPLLDVTGQSRFVDEYLGKENSVTRRLVSGALARVGREMNRADNARSLDAWKTILGDQ